MCIPRPARLALLPLFAALSLGAPAAERAEIAPTSASKDAQAEFARGRQLLEDYHPTEAQEHFKRAVKADPAFALALAYLGKTTPGVEGLRELEQAEPLAAPLGEGERLIVQAMLAERRGEDERVRELRRRIAEVAPNDWRAHWEVARLALRDRREAAALLSLQRALELNPTAAPVYNHVGYANLYHGAFPAAIEAFQRYAQLRPTEMNPQDSLGEAYLAAGRFAEAEEAGKRAAALSPKSFEPWTGVAQARLLRGDFTGARAAIGEAQSRAPDTELRLQLGRIAVWSYMAEGKSAEALRAAEALEKEAVAKGADGQAVRALLTKARLLIEDGKLPAALEAAARADQQLATAKVDGQEKNLLRRQTAWVSLWAHAQHKQVDLAEQSLAVLQDELKRAPSSGELRGFVSFGRGALALARGDPKLAAAAFSGCSDEDSYCRWQRVLALDAAGDTAGAGRERDLLLGDARRDGATRPDEPLYAYVRARLSRK